MSARGFAPQPLVMMMHGTGKAVQEFPQRKRGELR